MPAGVGLAKPAPALVLAGGLGTRLAAVSGGLPKCLMPVEGRPFVAFLLANLERWGVHPVTLALGHGANDVRRELARFTFPRAQIQVVTESTPLGTGGAIRNAAGLAGRWPLLVFNGDSFLEADLEALVAAHLSHAARVTMALAEVPDTGRFGRVRLAADGRVVQFAEKSSAGPGLINGGVYVVGQQAVEAIPPGRSSFERDVLPRLVGDGVWGFVTKGFFVDIGVPEDYAGLVARPQPLLKAAGLQG